MKYATTMLPKIAVLYIYVKSSNTLYQMFCVFHHVMSTFSFPTATPVQSPQPSQQHTPEPPLQPSTRATPSLLGKRRRDDGANKVLRQMLYESHRLDSLTDARNRQDAAFQQSMLEAIWEVTDAVQASNGQQELLIQNVNLLTLILQKQLEPPAPH
ncbi:uncharacterized protein LOC144121675 [Amblyomma americanum]